jgi:hypothetical protein
MTVNLSTLAAIRAKCIDCAGGQPSEVRLCPVVRCALHPFRFGKRPKKTGQELPAATKAALLARLGVGRKSCPENQGELRASERVTP